MRKKVALFFVLLICLVILTGCHNRDGIFVANKVAWECKSTDITKAYGHSSIVIDNTDFLTYCDNFVFEPYEDTFQYYPGTAIFSLNENQSLVKISLQIPIELDYSTTEDTVGFLYNLIQEAAVDYYNKEADVIEENEKDGISSMEWNSERGKTVIGYIKGPEGSTLPDYTLMITCTAPAYSDS